MCGGGESDYQKARLRITVARDRRAPVVPIGKATATLVQRFPLAVFDESWACSAFDDFPLEIADASSKFALVVSFDHGSIRLAETE